MVAKRLKLIVVNMFIVIALFFCSEWYQYNFDFFPGYMIEFYATDDFEIMKSDLSKTADDNGVMISFLDKKIINSKNIKYDVYADEETKKYYENKVKLTHGSVKSFFSGETTAEYHSFYEYGQESNNKKIKLIIFGETDKVESFWNDIRNTYNMPFPEFQSAPNIDVGLFYFSFLSVFILILCFVLSYVEYFFNKKEYFIKMTLGENIIKHILYNVIIDSGVYFTIWCITRLMMIFWGSNKIYEIQQIWLLIAVIVMNSLFYLRYLILSNNKQQSKHFLKIMSMIKLICTVLTCLTISATVLEIIDNASYLKQKSFFVDHSNSYWYNAVEVNNNDVDEVMNYFYEQHVDDMKIYVAYQYIMLPDSNESMIAINENCYKYLSRKNEGIRHNDLNAEKYAFINKEKKLSTIDMNIIKEEVKSEKNIIYYNDNIDVIAISNDNHGMPMTKLFQNPIIIFDNLGNQPNSFYTNWLIQTDKTILNEYSKKNEMSYSETSAIDFFYLTISENNHKIFLYTMLSVLMMFIQLFNTIIIIKLNYELESIELTVKKAMGYSNFERFKKHYFLIIISSFFSFILLCIIFCKALTLVVIAVSIILIIDLIATKMYILKKDKENFYVVLKGGIL